MPLLGFIVTLPAVGFTGRVSRGASGIAHVGLLFGDFSETKGKKRRQPSRLGSAVALSCRGMFFVKEGRTQAHTQRGRETGIEKVWPGFF